MFVTLCGILKLIECLGTFSTRSVPRSYKCSNSNGMLAAEAEIIEVIQRVGSNNGK